MAPTASDLVSTSAQVIGSLELPLSRKRTIAEKFIAAFKEEGVTYNWDDFYQQAAGSKGI